MVRIYFYSLIIITVGIYVPAVFLFTTKKDKNFFKKTSGVQERVQLTIDFCIFI
jgi:hypothetical protein